MLSSVSPGGVGPAETIVDIQVACDMPGIVRLNHPAQLRRISCSIPLTPMFRGMARQGVWGCAVGGGVGVGRWIGGLTLDEVRREAGCVTRWGRHSGLRYNLSRGDAQRIQRSRWALWTNPEDLTGHQRAKLAWIAATSPQPRLRAAG